MVDLNSHSVRNTRFGPLDHMIRWIEKRTAKRRIAALRRDPRLMRDIGISDGTFGTKAR